MVAPEFMYTSKFRMTVHAIARLVFETTTMAKFPLHIWATAMMYLHAFEECTAEREEDDETGKRSHKELQAQPAKVEQLMLGITCLVLSVKANENYLNSLEPDRTTTARLAAVLDASARNILSYTASTVPTERIVHTKRRLKDFIPATELSVMRVVGNSLVIDTAFSFMSALNSQTTQILVEVYSSPIGLNFSAESLLKFANGDATNRQTIFRAINPFFLSDELVEPISP